MKRLIGFSVLGMLLLALVFGCSMGMTLEARIQQFESDLNLADRSLIGENFHPDMTTDYLAIQAGGFFDIDFPLVDQGDPTDRYAITILDSSDPSNVTAQIHNPVSWFGSPFAAIFSMALDGLDYRIVTLQMDTGTGMQYIVQ